MYQIKPWQSDWAGVVATMNMADLRQFVAMRLWKDLVCCDDNASSLFLRSPTQNDSEAFANKVATQPQSPPIEILASLFRKDYGEQTQIRHKFLAHLAKKYQLHVSLSPRLAHQSLPIDIGCLELWQAVPLRSDGNNVVIGATEPYSPWLWLPLIQPMFDLPIVLQLIDSSNLSQLQHTARSIHVYAHEDITHLVDLSLPAREYRLHEENNYDESSIIEMCRWMFIESIKQGVSDIHLESKEDGMYVKERRNGLLDQAFIMRRTTGHMLISRIKLLAGLDITELRKPQDGRISVIFEKERQEIRVSTVPTMYGEKIVLRFFDPKLLKRRLESLGMQSQVCAKWHDLLSQESGMLLSVGPTGSGKTSTLYASLCSLIDTKRNVCTVEDPVEILHPSLNQLQVNNRIDMSFSLALKHLLRQDPDVIMIGEIRDTETATTAIQASLTGHLVMASLHAIDALGALYRLKELGIASYLLRSTLSAILAQRLVRTVCKHCRKQISPTLCRHCNNTGYSGRIGIFEFLPVHEKLVEQAETQPLHQLRQTLQRTGHLTLYQQGQVLVTQGKTTMQELTRVCPPPSDVLS